MSLKTPSAQRLGTGPDRTGLGSRVCTFFIHAPAPVVRLGRVSTGVRLEGAGPGQQQRLRPGESGEKEQNCGERRGEQR